MTKIFGKYIRDIRIELGLSLREVARQLKISHVYLGEIERGTRSSLPKKHWKKLLKIIPGLKASKLSDCEIGSKPIKALENVSNQYYEVYIAFAKRIKKQNLKKKTLDQIIELLKDN